MSNPNCEDIFGGDITPLSRFEQIALMIPVEPDSKLKHCLVDNVPLCKAVYEPNPSTLGGDVTCMLCRELWYFKVSPEAYRSKVGYTHTSVFTRYFDMMACHCLECKRLKTQFWSEYLPFD